LFIVINIIIIVDTGSPLLTLVLFLDRRMLDS
jgi:hypothetical protein